MTYFCSICGRSFSRKQNLDFHMMSHNQKPVNQEPIDLSDLKTSVDRLDEAVNYLSTGSGYVGSSKYPMFNTSSQTLQLEDSFDKMLKQFMQIMMIKQLATANNSSMFTDMMKFQAFLDGREVQEEENDPMVTLLTQYLSGNLDLSGIVKKKGGLIDDIKRNIVANQTDNRADNGSFADRIPKEEDILKKTPIEIAEIIKMSNEWKHYGHLVKNGSISLEMMYQQLLKVYPNFPRDKFDMVIEELVK